MSVAGLPDAAPARVTPTVEDDASGAPTASLEGKAFSATLHARVSQTEREDRLARKPAAPTAPAGVVLPAPPQPIEPKLDLALPAVSSGPLAGGAPGAAQAPAIPPPPANTLGEADIGAGSAAPASDAGAPHSPLGSGSPAFTPPGAEAPRAAAVRGGADLQLPAPASLTLTPAEAAALASAPPASAAAASAAAGAFNRPKGDPAVPAALPLAPTSAALSATAEASAKSVTVVNRPASGTLTIPDGSRARLRDAIAFVANQAALRKGAVGELEIPELGRIVVHAEKAASGAVDVRIVADRPETRGILHASTAAMAADLADANVLLGSISIDPGGGALPGLGRGATADDIRRDRAGVRRGNSEKDAPSPGGKRRVRIVL